MNFKELAIIGSIFLSLAIIIIVFARNARKIQEIDPVALEKARANLPQGKLAAFWLGIKRVMARALVFLAEIAVKWAKKLLTLAHYSLIRARVKLKKNTPLNTPLDGEESFRQEEEIRQAFLREEEQEIKKIFGEGYSLSELGISQREEVRNREEEREQPFELEEEAFDFKRNSVSVSQSEIDGRGSSRLKNQEEEDFFSFQQEKSLREDFSEEERAEELREPELEIFQGGLEEKEEARESVTQVFYSSYDQTEKRKPRPSFLGRKLRKKTYQSQEQVPDEQSLEQTLSSDSNQEGDQEEGLEARGLQEVEEEFSYPQEGSFPFSENEVKKEESKEGDGAERAIPPKSWLEKTLGFFGRNTSTEEEKELSKREELERVVSRVDFSDQGLEEAEEESTGNISEQEQRRREEKNRQKIQEQSEREEEMSEEELEGIEIDLNILEKKILGQIAKNPRDVKCYRRLGELYLKKGNLNDAQEAYELLLKITPGDIQAQRKVKEIKSRKETVSSF